MRGSEPQSANEGRWCLFALAWLIGGVAIFGPLFVAAPVWTALGVVALLTVFSIRQYTLRGLLATMAVLAILLAVWKAMTEG